MMLNTTAWRPGGFLFVSFEDRFMIFVLSIVWFPLAAQGLDFYYRIPGAEKHYFSVGRVRRIVIKYQ